MLNVLENGWVLGNKKDNVKVVNLDDYNNEIYNGNNYYEDVVLGVMSEETYNGLVKDYKTVYDAVATEQLEDVWNGEIIEVGERYLDMADGPWKVDDELKMSDIVVDVIEMVA